MSLDSWTDERGARLGSLIPSAMCMVVRGSGVWKVSWSFRMSYGVYAKGSECRSWFVHSIPFYSIPSTTEISFLRSFYITDLRPSSIYLTD